MTVSLNGLRVLVFGTERDSIEWLKKSLIHHGALVSTVESPKKVLRVLKNMRMDILIVASANTDAYQLIHDIRLRDSRFGGNVPAIFLSTDETGETRADALSAGFQEQLTIPVQLDRLLQAAYELSAASTKRASHR